MALSASKLREDIYRILDRVLETGEPVEIDRCGRRLRIVAVEGAAESKLARLRPHPDALQGDPETIVGIDWSETWRP